MKIFNSACGLADTMVSLACVILVVSAEILIALMVAFVALIIVLAFTVAVDVCGLFGIN